MQFSGPKTHPRTLLNCRVLNKLSYEAKQLRNVLEHVLELNVYIQNQSLNLHWSKNRSLEIAKKMVVHEIIQEHCCLS